MIGSRKGVAFLTQLEKGVFVIITQYLPTGQSSTKRNPADDIYVFKEY